ncbi:MAG TPA: hypothetical protein VK853_03615 [Ilumatobacteraceae bacterium]|nr:hypothetical protein [Ilumatobacteraceae bacterium]
MTDRVEPAPATIVGVAGAPCRALVTPWGDVEVLGAADDTSVSWHVAAEDRWHTPAHEPALRQRRIEGTAVVETRLRIPDGDAVQRVWSVPELGGLTVIEVENDSPLPFAVAFAGGRVLTERPPADVPIQGIELPDPAIVLPVGHRSSIRVAVPHDPRRIGAWALPALAPSMAVVRGWLTVVHRASRVVLPDAGLADALTAARCDLLLSGPISGDDDPVGFLFDVAELGRLGDDADAWMPEIVEPIAQVARSSAPGVDRALSACERLAMSARDDRAAGDIGRLRARRERDGLTAPLAPPSPFSDVRRGASVGRFVDEIEQRIADGDRLLPAGIPRRWLGADFEVHGIPTLGRSAVSFAVRWHGERPAVLWEQHGQPQRLTAPGIDPGWATEEPSGEALWAAPPQPTRIGVSIDLGRG